MAELDACGAIETRVGLLVNSPWAVGVRGYVLVARVRLRDRQVRPVDITRAALAWVSGGKKVWRGSEGAGCYPAYRGGNVL